jgi:hypothetical protein
MMKIQAVNLVSNEHYVSPYEIEVDAGDVILFSADPDSAYSVIIKNTQSVFNQDNYFVNVPKGGLAKTPPVLAAAKGTEVEYEVFCHSAGRFADKPAFSPPKIIVNP